MTLGANIARLRTQKNWSQGDLADALDISRQSVSKWETDTSIPELDKLLKLAELFGVTLVTSLCAARTLQRQALHLRHRLHPPPFPRSRRHPSGKSAAPSQEPFYCVPAQSFRSSACCSSVICWRGCCLRHRFSSAASSALR